MLMQTFALASAQVFALALSAYFQLTITLMILVVGFAILAFFQPFEAPLSQNTQVFCVVYITHSTVAMVSVHCFGPYSTCTQCHACLYCDHSMCHTWQWLHQLCSWHISGCSHSCMPLLLRRLSGMTTTKTYHNKHTSCMSKPSGSQHNLCIAVCRHACCVSDSGRVLVLDRHKQQHRN